VTERNDNYPGEHFANHPYFQQGIEFERERIRAELQRIRQTAYKPDSDGNYSKHTLGMMSGIAEAIDLVTPEEPAAIPAHYTPCCNAMTNWDTERDANGETTEVWQWCVKCGNRWDGAGDPAPEYHDE
jgi:hypothetical protein